MGNPESSAHSSAALKSPSLQRACLFLSSQDPRTHDERDRLGVVTTEHAGEGWDCHRSLVQMLASPADILTGQCHCGFSIAARKTDPTRLARVSRRVLGLIQSGNSFDCPAGHEFVGERPARDGVPCATNFSLRQRRKLLAECQKS